jgi:Pyruvate/2-oxoacid:ferredoxin oxidoreductase delta subunit
MNAYTIDQALCVGCGQCRRYCPIKRVITINADYQHVIVSDSCSGCGLCDAFCPVPGALVQMAAEQVDRKRLKLLRRVVWRGKWQYHQHPLMSRLTLQARNLLRLSRQNQRVKLAVG